MRAYGIFSVLAHAFYGVVGVVLVGRVLVIGLIRRISASLEVFFGAYLGTEI